MLTIWWIAALHFSKCAIPSTPVLLAAQYTGEKMNKKKDLLEICDSIYKTIKEYVAECTKWINAKETKMSEKRIFFNQFH